MERKRHVYRVHIADETGAETRVTNLETYWSPESPFARSDSRAFDEGIGHAAVAAENVSRIRAAEQGNGQMPLLLRPVSVEYAGVAEAA